MSNKRLFQVFDEMNENDTKNNTSTLAVSSNFISIDKVKGGSKLCMGLPEECVYQLMNNTHMAVVLIIDKKEYHKFKNQ